MENNEFEIYNKLKEHLIDENLEVVIEHSFSNGDRHKFYIDIAVKNENEIVAIFEVKSKIIKNYKDRGIYAKQCQLYRMSFPFSTPLIYLTDGNYFYEYNGIQFKESVRFEDVVNLIKGRVLNDREPDYNSFIDFLNENSKFLNDSFVRDIQEKVSQKQAMNAFSVSKGAFSFNSEYEELFFKSILRTSPIIAEKIYRYTSFNRVFEIISNESHTMFSIVCMNDKTECFYANEYVERKRNKDYKIDAEDITDSYKNNWRFLLCPAQIIPGRT